MDAAAERDAWANYDPSSDKSLNDVLVASQKFMVFQLAHRGTSIQSHDGKPWMRCIGFTSTLEEARALAKTTHSETRGETRIMPVARNFLASKSMYTKDNLAQQAADQDKSNAMVDAWVESRKQSFEDVRRRAEGVNVLETHAVVDDTQDTHVQDVINARIGKTQGVAHQVYWAAAIIPDAVEPSVIPLFAAATEQDMRDLVEVASRCKDLIHFSIHVAPTCTWLPLSNIKASETTHKHPLRQKLESRLTWKPSELVTQEVHAT